MNKGTNLFDVAMLFHDFCISANSVVPNRFGDQCAPEGLPEGVVSPNSGISASLVKEVPSTQLCEGGYFPKRF